jgi:hypothetical protein
MRRHLTVIAYPQELDLMFEHVAFAARSIPDVELFVRCQTGLQLDDCVMNAGPDLTHLDLVGHGSANDFWLGNERLLASGQKPHPVFAMLHERLPKGAEVRLLGCLTGISETGMEMLGAVSRVMPDKKVFGTTTVLYPSDFGERGLSPSFEALYLISSRDDVRPEALNRVEVPTEEELKAASKWAQDFPGYQPLGRKRPLARTGFSCHFKGAQVSFACNGWLVQIEDASGLAPLLLRWSNTAMLPPVIHLLEHNLRAS